jgi:hypothetical protein
MMETVASTRRAVLAGVAAASWVASPASAAASVSDLPARTLSARQARDDVAMMTRALRVIHPGLTRYTPPARMEAALDQLARRIDRPVADVDLYARIAATLALVKCSHTKAEPPRAVAAWRETRPTHLPFRFAIIERRMIVLSGDARQDAAPGRGAEVLAINGRSVRSLIGAIAPLAAVDGFTDPARLSLLGDDSDLMGADLDHYWPFLFGVAARFAVRWRPDDSAPARTTTLDAIGFSDWKALPADNGAFRSNFGEGAAWRMATRNVGVLTIPTFVNYRRPVDAAGLYARALGDLTSSGMQRLVIDLRANGGGSDDAALALIDALAPGPYCYQRAVRLRRPRYGDLADHIETWGDRAAIFSPPLEGFIEREEGWFDLRPELAPDILGPRRPAPNAFAGPVDVLIGPQNASGATMTIARLKAMGRVRTIGEATGGSAQGPTAGRIFMLKLPESGIVVRIPQRWNLVDAPDPPFGLGVAPDVAAPATVADLRAGRDAAIAVALAVA